MNQDVIKKAIDVIESGDGASALDVLREWIASAAAPETDVESEALEDPESAGDANDEDAGSEGDGAEGVAPPAERKRAKNSVEHPRVAEMRKIDEQVRKGRWAHESDRYDCTPKTPPAKVGEHPSNKRR